MKNINILIIDDETSNLLVLKKILKYIGFQNIETAENGQKAMNKINQDSFDLILTDIKMPDLSGSDVLRHAKSIVDSTSVIGMSGTSWLLNDEFDAVISKPFTKPELLEVIDSVISYEKNK